MRSKFCGTADVMRLRLRRSHTTLAFGGLLGSSDFLLTTISGTLYFELLFLIIFASSKLFTVSVTMSLQFKGIRYCLMFTGG